VAARQWPAADYRVTVIRKHEVSDRLVQPGMLPLCEPAREIGPMLSGWLYMGHGDAKVYKAASEGTQIARP
jgi:hypothetical protein